MSTQIQIAGIGGDGFTHYLGEAFNGGIIYYLYKGSDGYASANDKIVTLRVRGVKAF